MTVLWNTGDKTANVTLSGGSLIAAMTSSSYGGVRADTSAAAGKIYYEVTPQTTGSLNVAVGWANSTASLTTYIGQDKNSWCYFYYTGNTNVWLNNGSILTTNELAPQYSTICVAFDIDTLQGWVKVNNSLWNGSATADPGTGVGGFSLATMNAGPYFPVFNSNVNGASVLANFGAKSFGYAIPSGFSGLDTNVQAYNASSKFIGYGVFGGPDTSADASKLIGYAEFAPTQTAAVASKELGYAELAPTQTAVNSSKFIAYAILSVTFGRSRVYFLD